MARSRADVISEMVDSGLFTDDEIKSAVVEVKAKQSRGPLAKVLGSAGEVAAAGPLAMAFPGAAPLTSRVVGASAEAAKDPEALATGVKVALPIAAGLATGGLGVVPAMGMAGLAGAGAEGYGQLIQRAMGSENAPKTMGESAAEIGKAGAMNVAFEGAGRGIGAVGKGVVNKLTSRAAEKAAKQSRGATAESIQNVYETNPEVATPGYFRKNIEGFVDKLESGLKGMKERAGDALGKAFKLKKVQDAVPVSAIEDVVEKEVKRIGLAANTREFRAVHLEIKRIIKAMADKGKDASLRDLADFERAVFSVTKSPSAPPIAKAAAAGIKGRLDKFYAGSKTLQKARKAYSDAMEQAEVIEEMFGVSLRPERTDLTVVERVSSGLQDMLEKQGEASGKVYRALKKVGGGVADDAEKLAAAGAGGGRLSAEQPMLPTVGMGNVGYVLKNPASGAGALGATAAVRAASNPTITRLLMQGAQKFIRPSLPGIRQAGAILPRSFYPGMTKRDKK